MTNNKYKDFTKEELLAILEKQDNELANKKYGLVWDSEKEPEQVVLDCENNVPVLNRISDKEIKTDNSEDNILIEGDNYHALTCLNYTHREKIDVIYIDPPYNTENKDFIYNDKYIDDNDGYRHSKWLNFMEKRLRLAKNLLKEDGVIFISIGKNEYAQLTLLVKKIFTENNFIDFLPREQKAGSDKGTFFSPQLDYILVVAKDKERLMPFYIENKNKKTPKSLYQSSLDSRPNQRYWVQCPDGSFVIPPGNIYPEKIKDGEKIKPLSNDDKVWRWSVDSYLKDKDRIFFKKTGQSPLINEYGEISKWNVYVKVDEDDSGVMTPRDYIFGLTNSKGSVLLKEMGLKFSNPKPIELVNYLINILNKDKGILVLDFFAGSGTTGHAVLELNKKDGGNRRFILVTNNEVGEKEETNFCKKYNITKKELKKWKNENRKEWLDWCEEYGIASSVTYPRLEKVINGYDFTGKDKTILFEKKLTFTNLYKNINQKKNESDDDFKLRKEKELNKNVSNIWQEVDKVIGENKDKFDNLEKEFKENTIKIIGIKNIDGLKDGLGGNLQYFKTDLIPVERVDKISDKKRIELTRKAGQMIAIKENTFGEIELNEWYQVFENRDKTKKVAIYFREDMSEFESLIDIIKDSNTILYVFSYSRIDKKIFDYLGKNISIEDIPEPIIDIYTEINLTLGDSIKKHNLSQDIAKAKRYIENKDKDDSARVLRVCIENIIHQICKSNNIEIKATKQNKKLYTLNDELKRENVFDKVIWEKNKTYITIGNNASHGEYDDFKLKDVESFYDHVNEMIEKYNVKI